MKEGLLAVDTKFTFVTLNVKAFVGDLRVSPPGDCGVFAMYFAYLVRFRYFIADGILARYANDRHSLRSFLKRFILAPAPDSCL
jgi:hypothetical protein